MIQLLTRDIACTRHIHQVAGVSGIKKPSLGNTCPFHRYIKFTLFSPISWHLRKTRRHNKVGVAQIFSIRDKHGRPPSCREVRPPTPHQRFELPSAYEALYHNNRELS